MTPAELLAWAVSSGTHDDRHYVGGGGRTVADIKASFRELVIEMAHHLDKLRSFERRLSSAPGVDEYIELAKLAGELSGYIRELGGLAGDVLERYMPGGQGAEVEGLGDLPP